MISIIMPTYNRGYTIEKAIKSVLDQSYKDWELIIVDDGSTDNTEEIVMPYLKQNGNIHLKKNTRNKGVAGARNTGIDNSIGRYLAFLDSDDQWLPNHLYECKEALKKTNRKVCSALWKNNYYGKIINLEDEPWYNNIFNDMLTSLDIDRRDQLWIFDDRLFEHIINTGFFCHHINTVVVEKESVERINGFNELYSAYEDLEFMFKLIEQNNLITVNNHHFVYNYGYDNIFAFINRSEMSLANLISDKEKVKKITANLMNKIKLFNEIKYIAIKSSKVKDKKKAIKSLNEKILKRYITASCINSGIYIKIKYLIKSFIYIQNLSAFKYLIKVKFSKYSEKLLCFD